jgi:hypothetical protein
MKKFRWLITLSFLAAALVCYSVGLSVGFTSFLVLGIVFELLFWFNLLKPNKQQADDTININAD